MHTTSPAPNGHATSPAAEAQVPSVSLDTHASPSPEALRPDRELLTAWLLLLLDSGATYGYDLRRELRAHQLEVDAGTVYRRLRRLEKDGWVQSRWMGSLAGPQRRFYRVTPSGRRMLDAIAGLIAAIRDSHDAFLQAYAGRDVGAARSAEAGAAPDEPAAREQAAADAEPGVAAADR